MSARSLHELRRRQIVIVAFSGIVHDSATAKRVDSARHERSTT
jgi:hypothetical protein